MGIGPQEGGESALDVSWAISFAILVRPRPSLEVWHRLRAGARARLSAFARSLVSLRGRHLVPETRFRSCHVADFGGRKLYGP